MSKAWTFMLAVVLVIGAGFLTGCSNTCDTCGGEVVENPCTCGPAGGGGGS